MFLFKGSCKQSWRARWHCANSEDLLSPTEKLCSRRSAALQPSCGDVNVIEQSEGSRS